MALRVHYTQSVGVDVTFESVRLGSVSGLTTNANQGTVGGGTIEVPDKGGLITIRGLKRMYVVDDASPAGSTMLFDGYNGPRTVDRGEFLIGTDRWWHCTLVDLNNLLTTFVIRPVAGTPAYTGVRPAETDVERVTWLLTTPYMQQVHDYGLVSTANPVNMSKADYTKQTAADVLRDCGLQAQKQWFVYYDESHTGDTNRGALFYDKSRSEVFNSTLSFSNVDGEWGDIDDPATLCFQVMPSPSPGIEFDPSNVVAGLSEDFDGPGSPTYRTRPATAAAFYWRDGTAPSVNVKTLAQANERADRMLVAVKDEAKILVLRAKLPRAKAGLILAGQRFAFNFEHLADQIPGVTHARVLALTFAHDTEDQRYYNIGIRADPLVPGCPDSTPDRTFPPLNPTTGNDYAPSDALGNIQYLYVGGAGVEVPTPYFVGGWIGSEWGTGGSPDNGMGGAGNILRFIVVGDGVAAVPTSVHVTDFFPDNDHYILHARLQHRVGDDPIVIDEEQIGIAGDTFTFTVSSEDRTICTHWIDIGRWDTTPPMGDAGYPGGATWMPD